VFRCQTLWQLAREYTLNTRPYDKLPASARRLLSTALVLAGSGAPDPETAHQYWTIVSMVNGGKRDCY
jgi:hypothetical protein